MATISAALVKDLREKTGAGMMDCKTALTETGGDIEAAVDWLRKKGLSKAAKKADRVAAEGLVGVATRDNVGVVVEVNSETDFVARNEEFQALVRGIAGVALEKVLGDGPYFAGTSFSLVDAVFAPAFRQIATVAHETGTDLSEGFPKVQAWAKALLARPSVQQAVPSDFTERYVTRLRAQGSHLLGKAA